MTATPDPTSSDRRHAARLARRIATIARDPHISPEAGFALAAAWQAERDRAHPEAAERRRAAEWKRALDASRREYEAWRALDPEARAAIEAGTARLTVA